MAFTAFRDSKPFTQLVFTAFVALICFIAIFIIQIILTALFFDANPLAAFQATGEINDLSVINNLKMLQVIQAILLFIVPPVIVAWLFHGKIAEYLHLNKSFSLASVLLIFVTVFFAAPFINFIGELNNNMIFPQWMSGVESWMKNAEEKAKVLTEAFLNVETIPALAFNLFMIAFLPAIGEELLFRGVIQKIFTNVMKNHHWGIWLSAIIFSALHFQFYGFVPRVILGALFGYMLVWSGSLWLPIIAHFLNNGLAVVAYFLINKNMLNPEVEDIGATSGSFYMAAISLILVVTFMAMLKRQNENNALKIEEPV